MLKLRESLSILLSLILIFSVFTVIPLEAGAAGSVSYIYRSWNGDVVTQETRTCTDYIELCDRTSSELNSKTYVVSHDTTVDSRLTVSGTTDIIICDGATLTLTQGITVSKQAKLSFFSQSNDTGRIYAHMPRGSSYYECAVIGGDKGSDAGDIYIHGGSFDLYNGEGHYETVNGYDGACIGGGNNSGAGEIVIYGGSITAKSTYAAAIGGGKNGQASWKTGESIRIYGGKVDAFGYAGAGIGNGALHSGSVGGVAIYGGEVTAKGVAGGAGIGGGGDIDTNQVGGSNGPITIYGGLVTASGTGSKYSGAGIGSGGKANQDTPVKILGGTVVGISERGAGIGSGGNGNSGVIEISDADVVASSFAWGAGIGSGYEGNNGSITITDSTVSALSCNYGSAQDFLNAFDQMVTYRKMKSDDQAYVDAAVNAVMLLVALFQNDYSGAAIGGGRYGNGGTIAIKDSTVEAVSGNSSAAIGGGQKKGFNKITIDHSDIIKANCSRYGAGIGTGDQAESGGTINIINGSNVKASGGSHSAGIGIGDGCGYPCTINISDSTVEAHGGTYGAGIGGGDEGNSGTIDICRSIVIADSKTDGAGIGGEGGYGGTVKIRDNSDVTARGGAYAAGIGGGDHSSGGTTTIENSIVRAYGGTDAAGIGGGEEGSGGDVSIFNSYVYAEGKEYGAGIGGGEEKGVTSVSIMGSQCRVEAVAGSVTYGGNAVAIGNGDYNKVFFPRPSCGNVTLNNLLKVKAGANKDSAAAYTGSSRFDAIRDNRYALIYTCDHENTEWRYVGIDHHEKFCKDCGVALGEFGAHDWNAQNICKVCGSAAETFTLALTEQGNNGEVKINKTMQKGTYFTAPACTNVPDNMEFVCWKHSDAYGTYYADAGERIAYYDGAALTAVYLPLADTEFINKDGGKQTVKARRLSSADLILTGGWYVVDSDITVAKTLSFRDGVKLILADGKTMTFASGVQYSFTEPSRQQQPTTFTVYGQALQSGKLDMGAGYPLFYNYKQYGGIVKSDFVVPAVKESVISRGTLTTGQLQSEKIVISGGNTDIGYLDTTQAVLGWTELSDRIKFSDCAQTDGMISITEGKSLTDGTKAYTGTLTAAQIGEMRGKTLRPMLDHNYGQPEWEWTNDYKDATAVFRCSDCGDVQRVKAKVTIDDSGEYKTATATCELYGKTYTDVKRIDIFVGHSLTLNGDIGVNFYLNLTDEQLAQGVRVGFMRGGKSSSVTLDKNSVKDAGGCYKATCFVSAAEMNDQIAATVTVGEDMLDETDVYSVRNYAEVIIANEDNRFSDKLITLAKTMLNYGANAQTQFDHNTEYPANEGIGYDLVGLTESEISAIAGGVPSKSDINSLLKNAGIEYYGYSVLLKTKTTLRFYFKKKGADTAQLAMMNGDNVNAGAVRDYNDDYCYIEVSDIAAYDLGKSYVLKFGDITLGSFSALSYVKDVLLNDNGAQPITDTVTALYRYNKAAVEYFDSIEQGGGQ